MDRDFQERYQQAEQAYGEERYPDAHRMGMGLLNDLNNIPLDADNEAAWFGWRSFVALLLGHISLYGLELPKQASAFYQLVLDSQPPDTQEQLAQQGLERARLAINAAERPAAEAPEPQPEESEIAAEPEAQARPQTGALPDLLKDPFLISTASEANASPTPSRQTAMPWLEDDAPAPEAAMDLDAPAVVTAEQEPEPEPEPEPEAEPLAEPEAEAEAEPVPDPEPVAFVESELVDEPAAAASPSRPTTRDDAMKALQAYWIRVDVSDLAEQSLSDEDIPATNNKASALNNQGPSIPIEPGQLNLSLAVSNGWRAFRASSWPFVAFTLISFGISVIFGLIGVLATGMADLTGTILGGSSSLCGTLINLWWLTGMTRGAWAAVHRDKPSLEELMRVDLSSCWRLFAGTLLVNVILALCIVVGGVGSAVVSAIMPLLTIVIFLLIGIGALVFSVNQSFLPFFTTVMEMGPMVAVKEGQLRVQPLWWRVLGLLFVEAVILAIGLMMLGIGLVAATPLMFCVSAAALQQIVGPMANAEPELLP